MQWNCPEAYRKAGEAVLPYLQHKGDMTITHTEAPGLFVKVDHHSAEIRCRTISAFTRGLSLAMTGRDEPELTIEENLSVEMLGCMLDVSRNGVPTLEGLKEWLVTLALMGYNTAFLYMEDIYQIPELPQFGYLRGAYSEAELREADDFASLLGIELIPAIQTLGHLGRAIRRNLGDVADTGDVLMVDSEETYEVLRKMIAAASRPFRTKRIHIGMDEAYDVGRGRHLDRYGYEPPENLMLRHLRRVQGILQDLGLQGILWSDMFFHMASPGGGSYSRDCVLSETIRASVPEGMILTYWDYYTEDGAYHREILRKHRELSDQIAFAGGIFTWLGPAPDSQKTLRVGRIVLDACGEEKVSCVIATTWGDNGSEGDLVFSSLLGLTLYAEACWNGHTDDVSLNRRIHAVTGIPGSVYRELDRLNQLPGLIPGRDDTVNPLRQLLWQDPLMPVFAADYADCPVEETYAKLIPDLRHWADTLPRYGVFFAWYARMCEVICLKTALIRNATAAVRKGDRAAAGEAAQSCRELQDSLRELAVTWRDLWLSRRKPFGFEIIDQRLGGQIQRVVTMEARLTAYAEGRMDDIPELTVYKQPFVRRADGTTAQMNTWADMISMCGI